METNLPFWIFCLCYVEQEADPPRTFVSILKSYLQKEALFWMKKNTSLLECLYCCRQYVIFCVICVILKEFVWSGLITFFNFSAGNVDARGVAVGEQRRAWVRRSAVAQSPLPPAYCWSVLSGPSLLTEFQNASTSDFVGSFAKTFLGTRDLFGHMHASHISTNENV